jgi:D-alanyl-D-alanine carboxypeptidase (penicillin-binding protein 5/6)
MNDSPFIAPARGRRPRGVANRRRKRRRALAVCSFALALCAVLLIAVAPAGTTHHDSAAGSGARAAGPRAPAELSAAVSSGRSPAGMALGTPPLSLHPLGPGSQARVHAVLRRPPRAGLLFNLSSGRVLWQRNPFKRLRVASLAKMMTALVTVRSAPADTAVLVTKQAVEAAGSKVGVLPLGRHVPLESMLYGLLLPSGNDAAEALAQRVSGSLSRFVMRMNAEAAKLGLGCSRFSSASGFIDAGTYSCAADLAVLAHVDLEQPRLARIVGTFGAVLPFPIKGGKLYLYNNNPLLRYGYPGLTGLKTGYTVAAGRCLVATAERHGVRLGVVLLHSPAPATQARELLDSAFRGVYHQAAVAEPPIPPEA